MKQLTFSKKRWDNLLNGLITLGKGRLDQQLIIQNIHDDFETLEALFNLVNEELRERLLHLSFVKPTDLQKHMNHFVFIINKDFYIKHVCDAFLMHFNIDSQHIKTKSFLDLIDEDTALSLQNFKIDENPLWNVTKRSLVLLNQTFLFNIKSLNTAKTAIINLYQLHVDTKHFRPLHRKSTIERGRLKQKKRNEDIIEQVKIYLDNSCLTQRLRLKQLCMDFGINSNQLKKIFKEQYQCTVYDYHISLRMKHAYMLIETGTLPFKEIAYMVGYPQYSAFVNYFKSYYKILPKELRIKTQNS